MKQKVLLLLFINSKIAQIIKRLLCFRSQLNTCTTVIFIHSIRVFDKLDLIDNQKDDQCRQVMALSPGEAVTMDCSFRSKYLKQAEHIYDSNLKEDETRSFWLVLCKSLLSISLIFPLRIKSITKIDLQQMVEIRK